MIYRFLPRLLITYSIHNISIIHTCICDRCNVKFHFSTTWYLHIVFIYIVTWWSTNSWSDLSKNCFCQSKVLILMCLLNSNMLPVQQATQPSNSVSHFPMRNIGYVQISGSPLIYKRQATMFIYTWTQKQFRNKGVKHVHVYINMPIYQFKVRFVAHTQAFMKPWYLQALHYTSKFEIHVPMFSKTVRTLALTLVSHQLSGMWLHTWKYNKWI